MKIYKDFESVNIEKSIIAIGKFDGLHKGHRQIIDKMRDLKEDDKTSTVVITFAKSPIEIKEGTIVKKILTRNEKHKFFEMQDVDIVIEIEDVKSLLDFTPEGFIKTILTKKLKCCNVVCGSDFVFGKNRQGDINLLKSMGKTLGFGVSAIEKVKYEGVDISSTYIRECIDRGDIKKANTMLSTPFSIIGKVEHGAHLGRNLGMPTINIYPDDEKLLPPFGVYKSNVTINDVVYKSITNIGVKPTVNTEKRVGVETYIFDFEGDLYDRIVEVRLTDFVRYEKKFNNTDELMEQINKDMQC